MLQFADEAIIEVSSGKGGNGCIAFRREKYIPHGGPNGGDGGKGGNVVFRLKRNMRTLSKLRHQRFFKAKNGGDGQGWNRYGKNGDDVVINVPHGTSIRDYETNELIYDFSSDAENDFVFLEGGKGGWGNMHFKTSTNQAPRYAHDGKPAEVRKLKLELSIMADVGLVGFPNAGKSSLLTAWTNARPKVAPYPFTTKIPHLGVLRVDDEDIIIADIPGILEGASSGVGLGFDFLKHISRTSCLLFMIDASSENYLTAYKTLTRELENYSADLLEKPRIVLCNKIDIDGAKENALEIASEIQKTEKDVHVIPISVLENYGLKNAQNEIIKLVQKNTAKNAVGSDGADGVSGAGGVGAKNTNSFLETRSVDDTMEVQYPGSEK